MQVYLNELCLQANDLYKLEDFINALHQKGVKQIYYASNIEDFVNKSLIDENDLAIWLTTFDMVQSKVSVFKTVYENGISYFIPTLLSEPAEIKKIEHTSIVRAAQATLEYPRELIALLHLSNCQLTTFGFCHVLRMDSIKQEITLIKLPVMDSLQKIQLFVAIDFIKKDRNDFEELSQTSDYKEALREALSFNFDKYIYSKEHGFLPLKKLSDFLIPIDYQDWKEWSKDLKSKNNEERNAANFEYGHKVAAINGYVFNKAVSQRNESKKSKREIFEAGKKSNKVYISIEFEKSFIFEVFDANGMHIGELNFDGTLKPQSKHSIIIDV